MTNQTFTFPVKTDDGLKHLTDEELAVILKKKIASAFDNQWAVDLALEDLRESVENDPDFVVHAHDDCLTYRYVIEDYTGDWNDHEGIIDDHVGEYGEYCLVKNV